MRKQGSVVFVDSEKDTKKYQAFMLFICYIIVLIIRLAIKTE